MSYLAAVPARKIFEGVGKSWDRVGLDPGSILYADYFITDRDVSIKFPLPLL